jgi:hypothetical protein
MAVAAIDHFSSNIAYVDNLLALARSIDTTTTAALDVGDVQRAAIVMAVSAMDHYVHERAREGMHEVLVGVRPETPSFGRFSVSMSTLLDARRDPGSIAWLDQAIRDQHGHRPFMKTNDIADAMRLISGDPLWPRVALSLGSSPEAVKAQIRTIVDRRNKIAHEADLDLTQPGTRWPISDSLATAAVSYVRRVVDAIEACT